MTSPKSENESKAELNDSGCVQDAASASEEYKGQAELMDLSDDVLLYILKRCTPQDLKALGHTCARLGTLVCDHTLWQYVDARSAPIGQERMRWLLTHCLTSATKELKVTGFVDKYSRCLGMKGPIVENVGNGDFIEDDVVCLRRHSKNSGRKKGKSSSKGKAFESKETVSTLKPLSQLALQTVMDTTGPLVAANEEAAAKDSSAAGQSSSSDAPKSSADDSEPIATTSKSPDVDANASASKLKKIDAKDSVLPEPEPTASTSSADASTSADISKTATGPSTSAVASTSDYSTPSTSAACSSSSANSPKADEATTSSAAAPMKEITARPNHACFRPRPSSPDFSNNNSSTIDLESLANMGKQAEVARANARMRNASSSRTYPSSFSNATGIDLIAAYLNSSPPGPNSSGFGSKELEEEMEILAASCPGPQFTFDQKLLRTLTNKCTNLTYLVLEYCNLDYKNSSLGYFPHTLKKLSLKGCWCYNVPENSSYLHRIQYRLPELESLDVSECDWFDAKSLISVSKVPNLRELYMRHCRRLTECVEYASLATRHGFKRLRIVDLRGSPVGDPEVSAFGWLPLLEELYCSPPVKSIFMPGSEHSHNWGDVLAPFTELDQWEMEVPEYYKCKTPPPEYMEEDEELKDEGEQPVVEERVGDFMLRNYMNWALSERRWNAIGGRGSEGGPVTCAWGRVGNHRNDQNQNEYRLYYDSSSRTDPQPGPSKRSPANNTLEGVKRQRLHKEAAKQGPIITEQDEKNFENMDRILTAASDPVAAGRARRARMDPPALPINGPFPSRPDYAEAARIFGTREVPDYELLLTGRSSTQNRPAEAAREDRPNLPAAPVGAIEVNDDRPGNERLGRYLRRLYLPALLRGEGQPIVQFFFQPHFVFYLVSDMAVLGFGRAKQDLIHQLHMAHNNYAHDPAVRPYQSNLRVLSITGYRDITDKSLQHLATAAPYMRRLDFSHTSVTPAGVEVFKAIRPNCEVVFCEIMNVCQ